MKRRTALRHLAWLTGATVAPLSRGQGVYPGKPIHLIVPSAPGGSTDTIFRILGQAMATRLNTTVLIDNKPGAGGNLASALVAKASPDGYTLLSAYGGFAIAPSLYKNLTFDPVKDFQAIAQVCSVNGILVVNPALPVHSVKELIQFDKSKPGQLSFASAGTGTVTHLAGELFNTMAGTKLLHVPYRGSSLALNDLLGGQVQVMFANVPGTIEHVKANKLRVLGIDSAQRMAELPGVPTVAEAGVPGYEASSWFGLLAPAGTPPGVVAAVNKAALEAMQTPEMRSFFEKEGAVPVGGDPEQFTRFITAQIEKWAPIVRASGATPE